MIVVTIMHVFRTGMTWDQATDRKCWYKLIMDLAEREAFKLRLYSACHEHGVIIVQDS